MYTARNCFLTPIALPYKNIQNEFFIMFIDSKTNCFFFCTFRIPKGLGHGKGHGTERYTKKYTERITGLVQGSPMLGRVKSYLSLYPLAPLHVPTKQEKAKSFIPKGRDLRFREVVHLVAFSCYFAPRSGKNRYKKQRDRNTETILRPRATLSGEVFKEPFVDIFHTNLEEIAFSLPFSCPSLPVPLRGKRGERYTANTTNLRFAKQNLAKRGFVRAGYFATKKGAIDQNPLPLALPQKIRAGRVMQNLFFRQENCKKRYLTTLFRTTSSHVKGGKRNNKTFSNKFVFAIPLPFSCPSLPVPLRGKRGTANGERAGGKATKGTKHPNTCRAHKAELCKKRQVGINGYTAGNANLLAVYLSVYLLPLLLRRGTGTGKKGTGKEGILVKARSIRARKGNPQGGSAKQSRVFKEAKQNKGMCTYNSCLPRLYRTEQKKLHVLHKKIGDFLCAGDKIGHFLSNPCLPCLSQRTRKIKNKQTGLCKFGIKQEGGKQNTTKKCYKNNILFVPPLARPLLVLTPFAPFAPQGHGQGGARKGQGIWQKMPQKKSCAPIVLNASGRVITINKTQLTIQKTQNVLFYNSANLHIKKGEWVKEGSPVLTLTHQTLITGDIVQGIPRIEQLFEAFTSPPSTFKDRRAERFKDVYDTLHSQVRDIFRKHWLKSVLPIAVRKSLEEIQYILVENIQKVYLSQGVLIADKHIEIVIRQIASKGQILDSGSTGLFLEEILPIRHIENANLTTPGKKCLYVPAVVGLTAAALSSDSFISAASFQETTRVLSRDAVVGKSDFLRGLKEKVVIGDLISAGTGLDIYFIYTTMLAH